MSLFNPFCKCLNPQRIVNPYTNEAMTVPCGHCKACILAKNSRYAFQCDLESYSSKHTLFITLTYANRFIPRAQFVDSMERPYGHGLVDVETGEYLGEADLPIKEIERLQDKFHLFGYLPYLRKFDLQLFFKRSVIMFQKDSPKKKCVILPLANTDLYTSARIIISYYSSNQTKSYKYVQRLYLRLGPMVVSTVSYPKVSVHRTLRAMLIAVCLYPKFLHYLPSVHSAFILKNWVKAFCKVNERKYTHLPLSSLLSEASLSMDAIRNLMYGGRLTLTSTPNVKDLLINLHVNVLTLMESMIRQGIYSRPPKRRSRLQKK